jgi:hypothetical protein
LKGLIMSIKSISLVITVALLVVASGCSNMDPNTKEALRWERHDINRPKPKVVTPGAKPGQAPSNAIVLFDGKDLSAWVNKKSGGKPKWKVKGGFVEVAGIGKDGDIETKQAFGDFQLHIEWASPAVANKAKQGRGNSGVFPMGLYELQVLDSYKSETYADGQAGAVYGQYPPLFNVCRKPGQWQSYDIIFHRPRFNKNGRLKKPGRITALHNGVLIQDNVEILGPTKDKVRKGYTTHVDKLPISLQDHKNPVRYRNIWVVELCEKAND